MTASGPRVSILVPVYNKAPFIGETLHSVLAQTHRDIEVIVVDDGSTDESLRVVEDVAAEDDRVVVITQANAGSTRARQRAYAAATGTLIIMLDADDVLYPRFVERAVQELERNPGVDIVHTSWHRIDADGGLISTTIAPAPADYLKDLLLGMLFAPSAMMFRKALLDRVGGLRNGFNPTEDWELVLRCLKAGARFAAIPEVLAAYREAPNSHRKSGDQNNRFFPVIEEVFDGTMGPDYDRLKPLSVARHHLFLMQDYQAWGDAPRAARHFRTALSLIRSLDLGRHPDDARYLAEFMPGFKTTHAVSFVRALRDAGAPRSAYAGYLRARLIPPAAKNSAKRAIRGVYQPTRRAAQRLRERTRRLQVIGGDRAYDLHMGVTIEEIRARTLSYVDSMRVVRGGAFAGYRHSASASRPVLYATVAALLVKHLYDERGGVDEELAYLASFQREDGLFVDPVIACDAAESEDWWGWRHLTLHALMTLALYARPACHRMRYLDGLGSPVEFREYLRERDWGARAAWTSNELQNLGVMLQYARDYQSSESAGPMMQVLYDVMEEKQDPASGLYGARFSTPDELSLGVQAGYHLWLLYFYDRRAVPLQDRIIESVLATQNPLGGYGVKWNSSACEDIDSVDPLVRLHPSTERDRLRIQESLRRALPAILQNLNADGGWVFRRHESLTIGHSAMFSAENESNMFYTWFRTLGLAYCLSGMNEVPAGFGYRWNFGWAPGHQFL